MVAGKARRSRLSTRAGQSWCFLTLAALCAVSLASSRSQAWAFPTVEARSQSRVARQAAFDRGVKFPPMGCFLSEYRAKDTTGLRPTDENQDVSKLIHIKKMRMEGGEGIVFDYGEKDWKPLCSAWDTLDDAGGISNSRLLANGDGNGRRMTFFGKVAKVGNAEEFNGGHSLCRIDLKDKPVDLRAFRGLVFIAHCSKGLRYRLEVKDQPGLDSPSWSHTFNTEPGKEIEVRVPFTSLVPHVRGRTTPQAAPFHAKLSRLQVVLSEFDLNGKTNPGFQEGEFKLQLGRIRGYAEAAGSETAHGDATEDGES